MTLDELVSKLHDGLAHRGDVRFALLFGSAVSRGPEIARDVDVAIAFDRSPSLMEVGRLATELEVAVGKEVDIVDVDAASTLLRWEIVRSNRIVIAHDDELRRFFAHVPLEYADLKPYLDREAEGMRRALGVT